MSLYNSTINSLLISFVVTFITLPLVRRISIKNCWLDYPDLRKKHQSPVVRIGGVSIFMGVLFSLINEFSFGNLQTIEPAYNQDIFIIFIGSILFFILGVFDDIRNSSPFLRLIIEFAISSYVWFRGIRIEGISLPSLNGIEINYQLPVFMSLIFTCFFIVGFVNAFNWIDGYDGSAIGIAIIFFLAAFTISNENISLIIASFLGACLAFLPYNFKPSSIIMGDGGAYLLGFVLATISITISYDLDIDFRYTKILVPIFLLFLPLFDMIKVIIIRILNKKSIFYPDNNHIHFYLESKGYNYALIITIIYTISIIFSVIGLLFSY